MVVPPKWMVYNGKPYSNGMILEVPLFSETSILMSIYHKKCNPKKSRFHPLKRVGLISLNSEQIPIPQIIRMFFYGGFRWNNGSILEPLGGWNSSGWAPMEGIFECLLKVNNSEDVFHLETAVSRFAASGIYRRKGWKKKERKVADQGETSQHWPCERNLQRMMKCSMVYCTALQKVAYYPSESRPLPRVVPRIGL